MDTPEEVRRWLARRVRPLPPEVWRAVVDGGWVDDVLRARTDADDTEALEALVEHARREKQIVREAQRRMSPPGRPRRGPLPPPPDSFLSAGERARRDVL